MDFSEYKTVYLPLSAADASSLTCGELVLLSGTLLTARDAAHRKLCALIEAGTPLPLDLRGQTVYYTGPCPAPPGAIIGACGPTTSSRMDGYTPTLLRQGVRGMIGKGERSAAVRDAMKACGAVYFAAAGGAGALYAGCVAKAEVLCFPELLSEAVFRLTVNNMPVAVAADAHGNAVWQDVVQKGVKPNHAG